MVGKAAFRTEVGLNIPGSGCPAEACYAWLLCRDGGETVLFLVLCVWLRCFLLCPGSSASIPSLCGQTPKRYLLRRRVWEQWVRGASGFRWRLSSGLS